MPNKGLRLREPAGERDLETAKMFDDGELDKVITRMLRIDQIERTPA